MVSPLDGWRRKWTDLVVFIYPSFLFRAFRLLFGSFVFFSCIPDGIPSGIQREPWIQILTFVKRRQLQAEVLVSFVRLSSASLRRKLVSSQTRSALAPLWQSLYTARQQEPPHPPPPPTQRKQPFAQFSSCANAIWMHPLHCWRGLYRSSM